MTGQKLVLLIQCKKIVKPGNKPFEHAIPIILFDIELILPWSLKLFMDFDWACPTHGYRGQLPGSRELELQVTPSSCQWSLLSPRSCISEGYFSQTCVLAYPDRGFIKIQYNTCCYLSNSCRPFFCWVESTWNVVIHWYWEWRKKELDINYKG